MVESGQKQEAKKSQLRLKIHMMKNMTSHILKLCKLGQKIPQIPKTNFATSVASLCLVGPLGSIHI